MLSGGDDDRFHFASPTKRSDDGRQLDGLRTSSQNDDDAVRAHDSPY